MADPAPDARNLSALRVFREFITEPRLRSVTAQRLEKEADSVTVYDELETLEKAIATLSNAVLTETRASLDPTHGGDPGQRSAKRVKLTQEPAIRDIVSRIRMVLSQLVAPPTDGPALGFDVVNRADRVDRRLETLLATERQLTQGFLAAFGTLNESDRNKVYDAASARVDKSLNLLLSDDRLVAGYKENPGLFKQMMRAAFVEPAMEHLTDAVLKLCEGSEGDLPSWEEVRKVLGQFDIRHFSPFPQFSSPREKICSKIQELIGPQRVSVHHLKQVLNREYVAMRDSIGEWVNDLLGAAADSNSDAADNNSLNRFYANLAMDWMVHVSLSDVPSRDYKVLHGKFMKRWWAAAAGAELMFLADQLFGQAFRSDLEAILVEGVEDIPQGFPRTIDRLLLSQEAISGRDLRTVSAESVVLMGRLPLADLLKHIASHHAIELTALADPSSSRGRISALNEGSADLYAALLGTLGQNQPVSCAVRSAWLRLPHVCVGGGLGSWKLNIESERSEAVHGAMTTVIGSLAYLNLENLTVQVDHSLWAKTRGNIFDYLRRDVLTTAKAELTLELENGKWGVTRTNLHELVMGILGGLPIEFQGRSLVITAPTGASDRGCHDFGVTGGGLQPVFDHHAIAAWFGNAEQMFPNLDRLAIRWQQRDEGGIWEMHELRFPGG